MGDFALVDDLQDEIGDAVRMVLVYGETDYDHIYLRKEVRDDYSEADMEGLRREIIVFGLGKERIGDVTHVGDFRHLIYDTEDALSVQFPLGKHEGVFVSIGTEDEETLFDAIETTREWIDEQ